MNYYYYSPLFDLDEYDGLILAGSSGFYRNYHGVGLFDVTGGAVIQAVAFEWRNGAAGRKWKDA